jgi:hypothetical protein
MSAAELGDEDDRNDPRELVEHLVLRLGITREQAEGGAGVLLGFAQQRLSADQFRQVADAIPGVSDLIARSPRLELPLPGGWWNLVLRYVGRGGSIVAVAGVFRSLGLNKSLLPQFAAGILQYVRTRGAQEAEAALRAGFG